MPIAQAEYQRFATDDVADLVEHAWVVRESTTPGREVLLPDGRGLLQVVLGGPSVRTDPLGDTREPDVSGVRGLTTRAVVRASVGRTVRLGLQLHPLAGARLGTPLTDDWVDVDAVLGTGVQAALEKLLADGSDAAAVGLAAEALAALRRHGSDELDRFAEVVRTIDDAGGLVSAADLARRAGCTVSELYRWSVRYLGIPPTEYLAAVRFSTFVREAIGPGVVGPKDVVAALQWYVRAGYPPREVERFTGLEPVELRRLAQAVGSLVDG
ncbi:hypothetical protein [Cellulomonas sp. URHE0023]|uniref:hypothetical protein n=1 Tax=Cellulomonas sp. URHE0023 TaxID=1380354 RepID=UPI000486834C|nr:hypothetical protein [Cellulomonas sp. URHE0023]